MPAMSSGMFLSPQINIFDALISGIQLYNIGNISSLLRLSPLPASRGTCISGSHLSYLMTP